MDDRELMADFPVSGPEFRPSTTIRPLQDMVLVKPDMVSEKSGMVVVPTDSQDAPETGVIEAIGPGWRDEKGCFWPTELEPGASVLFPRYRGYPVEREGVTYLMMRERDLFGLE